MADEDDKIIQEIDVNVNTEDSESSFESLKEAAANAFESIKKLASDIGHADNSAGFDKLEKAGSDAFEAVKHAAQEAMGVIKQLFASSDQHGLFASIKEEGKAAFDELKTAAAEFGITVGRVAGVVGVAFATIATAIGLAAKAAFNFQESQSKVVNQLADLSDKTHTAIEDVSKLETAYAHAGVSSQEFASGYSRLSEVIEKTWDKIKKDTQTGVDTLEQRSISAARASAALTKIEKERSEALNDKNEPSSRPIDPFQGDLVTAESTAKALQKELELRQARLAAREAERAENEARRNDISQITKGVQDLIGGNQDALKTFNATADNIVKGVVAAAGQGSEALKGLGENFAAVGSKTPQVKDVLTQLAEALKNIQDPSLRSQVALQALGKSGESFLSAIDSGKLPEFIANVERMGGAAGEADRKIASGLKNALLGLNADLKNIGTSVSTAFGPGFTDAIKNFDDFIVRNQDSIRKLAELIGTTLAGAAKIAVDGFITLSETIHGTFDLIGRVSKTIDDLKKGEGFKTIKDDAKAILDTVHAIDDVTSNNVEQQKRGREKLFELRKQDAEDEKKRADEESRKKQDEKAGGDLSLSGKATEGLKSLVPTVDGSSALKINEILTRVLGGFEIMFDKLKNPDSDKVRKGLEGLQQTSELTPDDLAKTTAPPETGIVDQIKNGLQPLLDSINSLGTKIPEKITPENSGTGLGIRGEQEKAAEGATKMADAAEQTVDPLQQLKDAARGAAAELAQVKSNNDNNTPRDNTDTSESSSVAVADGGHIRGPGTGTSDSIPAWLSDGEFVVKKSAVDKIGLDALYAINEGRYAEGGRVGLTSRVERKKLPDGKIEETTYGANGEVLDRVVRNEEQTPEEKAFQGTPLQREFGTSPAAQAISDRSFGIRRNEDDNGDSKKSASKESLSQELNFGAGQQAVIDSLNEASEAAGEADPNFVPIILKRRRHADGGHVTANPTYTMPKFAQGGVVRIAPQLPRFASGGFVSAQLGAASTGSGLPHLGTVDLSTNHGTVRVAVDGGGITQLRKASVQRNMGSAPKSSWVR